jgi:hypothetical protein
MPSAISQAASFICTMSLTLKDYLHLSGGGKWDTDLWFNPLNAKIFARYELEIKELKDGETLLIDICSCYSPQDIPAALFNYDIPYPLRSPDYPGRFLYP